MIYVNRLPWKTFAKNKTNEITNSSVSKMKNWSEVINRTFTWRWTCICQLPKTKWMKCKMREKNSRNRRKANMTCSVCSMSFNNFRFLHRFLQLLPQHFSIVELFSWILLCSLFRFCIVKRFYLNKMLIMKLLQV